MVGNEVEYVYSWSVELEVSEALHHRTAVAPRVTRDKPLYDAERYS